jgi:hypothetical protein
VNEREQFYFRSSDHYVSPVFHLFLILFFSLFFSLSHSLSGASICSAETEDLVSPKNLSKCFLRVDYTCVFDMQFGCAFPCRKRFICHFQCQKLKNDIKNACDKETDIQTAHPKRKCNRPLMVRAQFALGGVIFWGDFRETIG